MKNKLFKFPITTKKSQEFVDITRFIKESIEKAGVRNGIAIIYCPHTTAGITINENADPDVVRDIIVALDKVLPKEGNYRHFEGNSHAHLKSSYMGAEKTIIIDEGELVLGTWQSIYFCEFDGPRSRNIFIKVMVD